MAEFAMLISDSLNQSYRHHAIMVALFVLIHRSNRRTRV
jgi:hypothetical protein